jgi:spermidine synthase
MYHVISTGIIATILYLISYTFYRTGLLSRYDHRRFWNIILAFSFLLTALAGLFLALQVTYKWDIPYIKTILKWHVECGTGLAFTGLFHLSWHLSYFFKKAKDESKKEHQELLKRSPRENTINLFLIGFVSSSIQLLLIREMMNIAGGYELIAGTFLGSWLIGSAAGSSKARRSGSVDLKKINLLFAISPVISLLLLILLSRLLLNPGETPSFFLSIVYTLVVLFPFTFVSGYTFIRILLLSKQSHQFNSGKSFSIETTGGIVAGIIVSIFSSGILNTYQLLLIIILGFLSYLLISFFIKKRAGRRLSIAIYVLLVLFLLLFNADVFFRQQLLPGIKVTNTFDTPYGNITSGTYGGEESLYYDHNLVKWQNDEMEREENIHYAMLQSNNPDKVLLISGNVKSYLPEIKKYKVRKTYFVERDPALIKLEALNSIQESDNLQVENADAYRYIRKTTDTFNVIILILPPPSTLLLNRFYTTDFFSDVKHKLGKNGIFMCSPGVGENYFNEESLVLYSSVFNSLSLVFRNVIPIVGNKLYYIASDGALSTSICELIEKKGINNVYVNSNFLSDDLIKMKSDELLSRLDPSIKPNSIAFPIACFHFQSYNLTKTLEERMPAFVLLVIVFFLPLFSVKAKNMIMYVSAASLAGFEIIMLLALQSTAGNMYQLTGLIIAGLMTGLASGSGIKKTISNRWGLMISSIIMILFYSGTGLIFNRLLKVESVIPVIMIILFLGFIPSFLTGFIYKSLSERSGINSEPSRVYSSDLTGSALGFIIISGLALPALGVKVTLFLLSALIFTGFLFGTIRNK